MLSKEENEKLKSCKICVVGCGGLGGYVIEMLGRLGIGSITVIDGDSFEETNLNRQILSDINSLGKNKAIIAKQRMEIVNPLVKIIPVMERLNNYNAVEILKGHDLVIDAVDNIKTRFIIQRICSSQGMPMVHGAIAGWYGQITTIYPGDNTLDKIYPNKEVRGLEKELGNPSFTPALIASIQVSEALKILLSRGELLRKKLLYIDLLDQDYFIMNLDK